VFGIAFQSEVFHIPLF